MDINEEIRVFMSQICAELGICDPLYDLDDFVSRDYYEADSFVREIFIAEGMDPDSNLKLFRKVKRKFTDQFGSEVDCNTASQ